MKKRLMILLMLAVVGGSLAGCTTEAPETTPEGDVYEDIYEPSGEVFDDDQFTDVTEATWDTGESMGAHDGEDVEKTEVERESEDPEAPFEETVNGINFRFDERAEAVWMESGKTIVFTMNDEMIERTQVAITVFDAADYAEQIQMVKEKNHENVDATGNTYYTATHTQENAVFAAYEDYKFIVISWTGDKAALDYLEYWK